MRHAIQYNTIQYNTIQYDKISLTSAGIKTNNIYTRYNYKSQRFLNRPKFIKTMLNIFCKENTERMMKERTKKKPKNKNIFIRDIIILR